MLFEFSEFRLELSDDWTQLHAPDADMVSFTSEQRNAGITISAQFYQLPPDKLEEAAHHLMQSREQAHAEQFQKPVVYLQRSIQPHSTRNGLEIFYAAEVVPEKIFCYLGYVTNRKILNLFIETSTCDQNYAAALFSTVVGSYEPKLP